MKANLGWRIPTIWLGVMSVVVLLAGGLLWLLVTGAPPQNAVLIEPAAGDTRTLEADNASRGSLTNIRLTPQAVQPAPAVPEEIVVYVSGAVANPGVYKLGPGARVADAVKAAGGLLASANPEAINLAARIQDEEHISVPERGATPEQESSPTRGAAAPKPTTAKQTPTQGKVNINRASEAELETLPEIGPALAARIVEYRSRNGAFRTVDELVNVSGIGLSTVNRLRTLVTVGP